MNIDDKTLVLWNASAGSAQKAGEIRTQLEDRLNWEVYESQTRDDATERVIEACQNGILHLIVAGGDGTINAAVEAMMQVDHLQTTLGILPLGTGNDFARSLGMAMNLQVALDQLEQSERQLVDLVRLRSSSEERYYANMLTAGNTGLYMDHLTDEIKHRWGPFSYLRGVIDVLQHLQVFEVEVEFANGDEFSCDALNLFVANGKMSGGGLNVCSKADLTDGLIDLVIVRNGDHQQIASLSTNYFLSDFLDHELIEYRQTSSLKVKAKPPLPLTMDGELVGESPLEVSVAHHRISVLMPVEANS